jgi:hypothetical protein
MLLTDELVRESMMKMAPNIDWVEVVSDLDADDALVVIPWVVAREYYEDNPDKDLAINKVATLMAVQVSNDIEDLLINGDVYSTHPLMGCVDGIVKRGTHHGTMTIDGLSAMAGTIKSRIVVGSNTWMDIVESVSRHLNDDDPIEGAPPNVIMSPFMDDDKVAILHGDVTFSLGEVEDDEEQLEKMLNKPEGEFEDDAYAYAKKLHFSLSSAPISIYDIVRHDA